MKREFSFVLVLVLALAIAHAEEYAFDASVYDAKELQVRLSVQSEVTLVGTGKASELQATLSYVPENHGGLDATPVPAAHDPLVFQWTNVRAGTYPFGFETVVTTNVQRPIIAKRVPYPFVSPPTVTAYLQPQEIIDTNAAIRKEAQSVVGSTDDSLEAVFRIATWVQSNVDYDLNTVTSQASKKASWVYENRYGVCDELTSLFIAMSRESGIPARFVSGIAYTNLEQFPDHWGPHGWAEVWLPEIGWVPVDVTYGQIGYVDATHIPIRHGLDAANTAANFSLFARDLTLQTAPIETQTTVLDRNGDASEPISLSLKPLYELAGSQSGNLLSATVRNDAPYYVALELYLAAPEEVTIYGGRTQQILLPPKSTALAQWRVSLGTMRNSYVYTIPFTVVANRAGNASTQIHGSTDYRSYALPPEAPSGTSTLAVSCEEPELLYVGESATVTCVSSGAKLCATQCAQDSLDITYTAREAGAFPTIVRATKALQKGNGIVTFLVEERPTPTIKVSTPTSVAYNDLPTLDFAIESGKLTAVTVQVQGPYFAKQWNLSALERESFSLQYPATYLRSGENEIHIVLHGKDKNGAPVEASTTVHVHLEASLVERIRLTIAHLFL